MINGLTTKTGVAKGESIGTMVFAFWPFMAAPLAIAYVYVTSYFGFDGIADKAFNEPLAFPIVGLSALSFFCLAGLTGSELAIAMTLLNIAFFCREWHFAGTDTAVYVSISLFTAWFIYRRKQIEATIAGKKIKIWLFATAFCYLFSQILARRVFSAHHLGWLPKEGQYFIAFEETTETAAHLMMLITSIIAWVTFYPDRKKHSNRLKSKWINGLLQHSRKKSLRTAVLIIIALVIGGGCIWHHKTQPYHFKVVEPAVLYRSGWMKPEDMDKIINKYKIQTVVNLCVPEESTYRENYKDEQRVCQKNRVTIVNIPMCGNTPPTPQQMTRWLNLLKDKRTGPILVHCAQGATRTAAMVAVYEMEFKGKDGWHTVGDIETFGHSLNDPKRRKIRDFIVDYKTHIANTFLD